MKKKLLLVVLIGLFLLSACGPEGRTIEAGVNVESGSDAGMSDDDTVEDQPADCPEGYICVEDDGPEIELGGVHDDGTNLLASIILKALPPDGQSPDEFCRDNPDQSMDPEGWTFTGSYVDTSLGETLCFYESIEGSGGGDFASNPDGGTRVATQVEIPVEWEVGDIDLLGEFFPHVIKLGVVDTIYEDAEWSQPDFSPPWPAHQSEPDRQDCPMVNGAKVWCTIMVRPGDVVIYNADGISTPSGSYVYPSGGWFTNQTTYQIEISFMFGELVVVRPAEGQATVDADEMARVMLKLVVSTNGLTSAAYLGQIKIH
jgi:hypothetical protein